MSQKNWASLLAPNIFLLRHDQFHLNQKILQNKQYFNTIQMVKLLVCLYFSFYSN